MKMGETFVRKFNSFIMVEMMKVDFRNSYRDITTNYNTLSWQACIPDAPERLNNIIIVQSCMK